MDDDADPLGRKIEQPARLDHLERLVHHRRRVDRDLAAHDPVRVRAGLVRRDGVQRRRRSRCRNGPPDAVSTMWSMRSGQVARSSGRHWKIAECSLSIGSSAPPPARTASTNSAPPTTSASLFASSRRLPACAADRQGARPAAPTIAAMTASTSGCDARSHRACGPQTTSVCDALGLQPLAQRARRRAGGHRRIARLPARALPEQLVDAALRAQGEHLVALRVTRDHVQRVDTDRAGRPEDADPLAHGRCRYACASSRRPSRAAIRLRRCPGASAMAWRLGASRSTPSQGRSETPAAAHRCDRGRRHARAAIALLSLAPALRFTSDSKRSPTTLIAARNITPSARTIALERSHSAS